MKKILSGNEAVARGVEEAGADFATGYPGTPSTEIIETLGRTDVPCQWSVNEKVALEVAAGASWAGGRVLMTTKHVGLNVAADPLFTLAYTGVRGGLVIINADDPQQFSSQNEQDNRHYARSAKVPMLEPADSQEAKEHTRLAFDLSEKYDTPVIVRTTTRIAHGKSIVELGPRRPRRKAAGRVPKDPRKLVMVPEFGRARHVILEERMRSLEKYADETDLNEIIPGRDRSLGIISSGAPSQYAREVFPHAGLLKLGLVHPLPRKTITRFCRDYKRVIVVEELDPFIEDQIRSWGIRVEGAGKRALTGELTPDLVRQAWGRKKKAAASVPEGLPPRPPVMCPGCPHRGIFSILKRKGIFVTGDIGCYTLAAVPPLAALDSCLCMGASIGTAQGMEKVLSQEGTKKKVAAVIGDSTFFHSGIPSLADLVYNKSETLSIVLDNRTTAMTGRQEHPGSGKTLKGDPVPPMDIARLGRAMGMKNVVEVNAYDYAQVEKAVDRLLNVRGPALLVNKGDCVLLERIPMAPPLEVDEKLCDGCRRCLTVSCPSLALTSRKKGAPVTIDSSSCYGCDLCARVCTRNAILPGGKK